MTDDIWTDASPLAPDHKSAPAPVRPEGYHIPARADYFEFDASVADVFDNMAARSLPGYRHFWDMVTLVMSQRGLPHWTQVWDMGVSTGTGLDAVRRAVFHPYASFHGIDISEPMLEKAKQRCPYAELKVHDLLTGLPEIEKGKAGVFIWGWTLQFIKGKEHRAALLRQCAEALHDDGIIFVAEKFDLSHDPELATAMQDAYISWRVGNGYTLEEIAAKQKALAGSMDPWTHEELLTAAAAAGLKAKPIYRQFSFGGYALVRR